MKFEDIITSFNHDNTYLGSLKDMPKYYTNSEASYYKDIFQNANAGDGLISTQYKALIDVYLKNHEEYRSIQTQAYLFISGISIAGSYLFAWTFNGYAYACFALLFLSFCSWILKNLINTTMKKNRFFHKYTAFVIRAIEDSTGLYNIPLRSVDFDSGVLKLIKKYDNNDPHENAGVIWKDSLNVIMSVLYVAITILAVIGFIYFLYSINI